MKPRQFRPGLVSLTPIAATLSIVVSAHAETWSGATNGTWDTTTENWLSDGSNSLFESGDDALFTGTPTNNVTSATGLTIGAITLDSSFTGSVTLTGANTTVTGPTTINGGLLSYSNNNQLGTSAITLSGGTLSPNVTAGAIVNNRVITVGASGGTINVENTSGGTPTFIMGAGNLTGSGALTVTGGGTLVHGAGADVVVLNGANAGYTGSVTIKDGGIIEYANSGGVGTGATFTVGNNGELSVTNGTTNAQAVTVESGGTLAFQNGNGGVFSGPITLNGSASVRMANWWNSANVNGTISGAIDGAGGLNVVGGFGILSLTNAGNSYTGATTVTNGTLSVSTLADGGANSNIGASANTADKLILNGGTLKYTGAAVSTDRLFSLQSNSTIDASGTGAVNFTNTGAMGFNGGTAGKTLTLTGTNTGANTIAANIGDNSGATTLIKNGTGAWTLSGANTYTGAATVSAGTLNFTGSGSGAGQLIVNSSGTNSVVNFASGAGSYGYNNAHMLVGNNASGAGVVNQSAGTITGVNQLQIGAASGGSYGAYNLSGGSISIQELDLGGFNGAPNGVINISSGTLNASNWLIVSRGSGGTGLLNMTGGELNFTSTVANQLLMNFNANAGQSAIMNVANATFTAADAGAGVFDLMRSGAAGQRGIVNLLSGGVMQVQGVKASNATGTSNFNFNGGTLKASNANGSFLNGITAANVYSGGGTIDNNGVDITVGQALSAPTGFGVNGTTISVPDGGSGYIGAPIVTFSGGTGSGATGYATVSNGVVTGIVITSPGTGYTDGDTLTATFSGGGPGVAATGISGITVATNTSGGLTFTGNGITSLTGASTYSGGTTLSAGTLLLGNDTAAGTGTIKLDAGTLGFSANNLTIANGLNVTGSATLGQAASNTVTLSGALTGSGTLQNYNSGSTIFTNLFFTGDLSGFNGTISYSGSNTNTTAWWRVGQLAGATTDMSNATLQLNVGSGGTAKVFGFRDGITTANTLQVGALTGDGRFQGSFNGTNGVYNTLEAGALGTDSTFSGIIGIESNNMDQIHLTKVGDGTLTLTGANLYKGTTTINAGTLQIGNGGTTGSLSASSAITNNGALVFNRSDSVTQGTHFSDAIGGAGSLTQEGAGTMTLSSANTYTGATTVSGGKLVINGSITSNTTVASGATVGGSGTITGNLTLSAESASNAGDGGKLAAGNSPGLMTVTGTTDFDTGSIFEWDLNATTSDPGELANQGTYDQVVIGGNLTGGDAVFQIILGSNSFSDAFWNTSKTWDDIFTADNSYDLATIFTSFSGAEVNSSGVVDGRGTFTLTDGSTLTWSAVPEPTSAFAGFLIGAGLLSRRRKN